MYTYKYKYAINKVFQNILKINHSVNDFCASPLCKIPLISLKCTLVQMFSTFVNIQKIVNVKYIKLKLYFELNIIHNHK